MLCAKYRPLALTVIQNERDKINTGVLRLIRAGSSPDKSKVFTAYTGRGGLHDLEFSDFANRYDYTRAKQEIEQGQFFTPDWVTELAARVIDLPQGSSICDPTCGHGAWFNWFGHHCRLFGNDIDPDATVVAKYLFPEAEISGVDLRAYCPERSFDAIVGNPPFGLRLSTGSSIDSPTQRSEDIFLDFITRHLRLGGSSIFIVPLSWLEDEVAYSRAKRLMASFIIEGQFLLPETLFSPYGCDRIATKLVLLRTRLSPEEPQGEIVTIDARKGDVAAAVFEWLAKSGSYQLFRAQARAAGARLSLEQARLLANREDALQKYSFEKYVFHLSRINLESADYEWRRWVKAHEQCPEGMKYEEWERSRLRPETVIQETRRAVRLQHKRLKPLVRLTQTKDGLALKSYSPGAASALANQKSSWTWLELEYAEPDFEQLSCNLERLNARTGKAKISYISFNWEKPVRRYRGRLALWRRPINCDPDPVDLAAVQAGYDRLRDEYGLSVRREELQEERLAQIIAKDGALLAWQQGVGKTYAALVFSSAKASADRQQGRKVGASLVVTSSLAVHRNWLPELRNAGRHVITTKQCFGNIQPESWIVLTHHQAHQYRRFLRKMAKAKQITTLILDEADEYANHFSRRYQAVRTFSNRIRYRLLTTGTPARNTAAELFAQLDIVFGGSPAFQCVAPTIVEESKDGVLLEVANPDYLLPYRPYSGYSLFRRCHAPSKATVLGKKRLLPDILGRDALGKFLSTIRSRLTLEELRGYDPVLARVVDITATSAERALYKQILSETSRFVRRELDAARFEQRKLNQLALAQAIRILQQACSIPAKFPEFQGTEQAKLEYIVSECEKNTHSHIAIGTIWKHATAQIAACLKNRLDCPVIAFTGDASKAAIGRALADLARAPRAVLVTTQQALRSSINIPCVSKVIAESLPWNFSSLGQYARRFARYNSPHEFIKVDLLVTRDTIEERILGLNVRKEGIALFAAGDALDDDLDPVLDQYGADTSALLLLAAYLDGERDDSLNLANLRRDLRADPEEALVA